MYWIVQDDEGLVHSVHSLRASAWHTLKWLEGHHPRFYANWFVQPLAPERLHTLKWRKDA